MIKEKIEESLDEIRKSLRGGHGDVELVEMTADNVVKIKLKGTVSYIMAELILLFFIGFISILIY